MYRPTMNTRVFMVFWFISGALTFLVPLFIFGSARWSNDVDDADYSSYNTEAYANGNGEGDDNYENNENGYDNGYNNGKNDGFSNGYKLGYNNGYNKGYNSGYFAGYSNEDYDNSYDSDGSRYDNGSYGSSYDYGGDTDAYGYDAEYSMGGYGYGNNNNYNNNNVNGAYGNNAYDDANSRYKYGNNRNGYDNSAYDLYGEDISNGYEETEYDAQQASWESDQENNHCSYFWGCRDKESKAVAQENGAPIWWKLSSGESIGREGFRSVLVFIYCCSLPLFIYILFYGCNVVMRGFVLEMSALIPVLVVFGFYSFLSTILLGSIEGLVEIDGELLEEHGWYGQVGVLLLLTSFFWTLWSVLNIFIIRCKTMQHCFTIVEESRSIDYDYDDDIKERRRDIKKPLPVESVVEAKRAGTPVKTTPDAPSRAASRNSTPVAPRASTPVKPRASIPVAPARTTLDAPSQAERNPDAPSRGYSRASTPASSVRHSPDVPSEAASRATTPPAPAPPTPAPRTPAPHTQAPGTREPHGAIAAPTPTSARVVDGATPTLSTFSMPSTSTGYNAPSPPPQITSDRPTPTPRPRSYASYSPRPTQEPLYTASSSQYSYTQQHYQVPTENHIPSVASASRQEDDYIHYESNRMSTSLPKLSIQLPTPWRGRKKGEESGGSFFWKSRKRSVSPVTEARSGFASSDTSEAVYGERSQQGYVVL